VSESVDPPTSPSWRRFQGALFLVGHIFFLLITNSIYYKTIIISQIDALFRPEFLCNTRKWVVPVSGRPCRSGQIADGDTLYFPQKSNIRSGVQMSVFPEFMDTERAW
jgi:late competence protein required for DNA uptake (superfamily II DNA/RNA helicase)